MTSTRQSLAAALLTLALAACGDATPQSPGEHPVPASVVDWRNNKDLVAAVAGLPADDRAPVSRFLDEASALESAGKPSPVVVGMTLNDVLLAVASAPPPPTAEPEAKPAPEPEAKPAPEPAAAQPAAGKSVPHADKFEPKDCEFAETEDGSAALYDYCEAIGGLDCGADCPASLEQQALGSTAAEPAPTRAAIDRGPFVGCYLANGRRVMLNVHSHAITMAWGGKKYGATMSLQSTTDTTAKGKVNNSNDPTTIPNGSATLTKADGGAVLYLTAGNRADIEFRRHSTSPRGCQGKYKG